MKKRFFASFIAVILLLGVCGCTNGGTVSEYTEYQSTINNTTSGNDGDNNNSSTGNASANSSGGSTGNASATNSGSGSNNGGQGTTVASKPSQGSTSATNNSGKTVELANPVYVAEGSTPMDTNLNFGGKTFSMATRNDTIYTTGRFKRLVAAFEKKYNCKINVKSLDFNNYAPLISNAKNTGNPYDIIFCHGSRFPEIPLSGVVTDLSSYLTTADYDTGNGGIDIAKSSYFVMDKNLYGVVGGEDAVYPYVIFYNKLLFQKYGLEDPYELYKSGKWTWTKFREMGQKVAGTGTAFGDMSFSHPGFVHSLGVPLMTWKNNQVVINLNDANVVKGFQLMYDLFNTSKVLSNDHKNYTEYQTFANGRSFCFTQESQKYQIVCEYAAGSPAFNKNASNVGIVPFPQDSASSKRGYSCGWYTAVMAGSGCSDPRVAVAFAKFWSTYQDPVKDKYELSDEYKALVKKLISGNIANFHGGYTGSDGSKSFVYFTWPLCQDISLGSDVTSTINSTLPQIQACVDYTMKK